MVLIAAQTCRLMSKTQSECRLGIYRPVADWISVDSDSTLLLFLEASTSIRFERNNTTHLFGHFFCFPFLFFLSPFACWVIVRNRQPPNFSQCSSPTVSRNHQIPSALLVSALRVVFLVVLLTPHQSHDYPRRKRMSTHATKKERHRDQHTNTQHTTHNTQHTTHNTEQCWLITPTPDIHCICLHSQQRPHAPSFSFCRHYSCCWSSRHCSPSVQSQSLLNLC